MAVKDAFRAIQARWHAPLPLTYLDMVAGLQAALPYLAPAGDGGLREALETLIEEFDEASRYDTGLAYARVATRLRDALAAHPAAPAVPQPAGEVAEDIEATGFYYCETAGEIEALRSGGFDVCCDKPHLHVPLTRRAWDAIRAMAADQTRAVPQPVDREALEQLVAYFRAQREGCEQLRAANEKTGADLTAIDYHARAETWRSATDAVLAVLAEPEAASDSESR